MAEGAGYCVLLDLSGGCIGEYGAKPLATVAEWRLHKFAAASEGIDCCAGGNRAGLFRSQGFLVFIECRKDFHA